MSLNPLHPLSYEEATQLAGCLLTSSTIERYFRCLQGSRVVKRLLSELRAGTIDGKELLKYAWLYRTHLGQEERRSEWEIPLAAIVCTLGQTGIGGTERLLTALAVSSHPPAAWVAGLSRRLLPARNTLTFARTAASASARRAALMEIAVDNRADVGTTKGHFPMRNLSGRPVRTRLQVA